MAQPIDYSIFDYILDSENRFVTYWLTTEIEDAQKQTLPIELFKKRMNIMQKRHAPVHVGHTNKTVGELNNHGFGVNPNFKKEGCWVTLYIFDDYRTDDAAWKNIQDGEFGMVSIGGEQYLDPSGNVLDLEPCEIALTPKGANPAAVQLAVAMAKSTEGIPLEKPFGGYKDFAACVAANGDKRDPQAYCGEIKHAVEKAESVYDSFSDCVEDKMANGLSREAAVAACRSESIAGGVRDNSRKEVYGQSVTETLKSNASVIKAGDAPMEVVDPKTANPPAEVKKNEVPADHIESRTKENDKANPAHKSTEEAKEPKEEPEEIEKEFPPKKEAPATPTPPAKESESPAPAPADGAQTPAAEPAPEANTDIVEIKTMLQEICAILKGAQAAAAPTPDPQTTLKELGKTTAQPLLKVGATSITPRPMSSAGYTPGAPIAAGKGPYASVNQQPNDAVSIAKGGKKLDLTAAIESSLNLS